MSHIVILLLIIFLLVSCTEKIPNQLLYIDKNKPSLEPQIFAKDIISIDSIYEYGSIFNESGNEFFFAVDIGGKAKINYTKLIDDKWIEPIPIIFDDQYSFNDPFLSPDENRLYYISDQPRNEQDSITDYDIWYSERHEQEWSKPINAGIKINSDANEYYISFTNDGSMYFASNKDNYKTRRRDFDIYKSQFTDDKFSTPNKLSESINSDQYEADVFISPDESYIIFCSVRESGFGEGDLYISFKNKNGSWTKAKNMGESINSKAHELCPFVSKDGKYLFYTSNKDIYWVSTEILEYMKEE